MRQLRTAFDRVERSGKGTAGSDDITVAFFAKKKNVRLRNLRDRLRAGSFQFSPLRPIAIPKKGKSGYRPLLIPTVEDRVVQRAILGVIAKPLQPHVSHTHSHAFREHVGVGTAVRQLTTELERGKKTVLTVDIVDFFPSIDVERVFDDLLRVLPDDSLDGLLRQLQRWEINDLSSLPSHKRSCFPSSGRGIPQGSALSPIVSNFYLRGFDAQAKDEPFALIRYADDIAVVCDTRPSRRGLRVDRATLERYWLTSTPTRQ